MMNNSFRIRAFSLASAVVMTGYLPSAHAEAKAIEVRPGDSLSRIVATQYPDYGSNPTVMRFILEKNPQAFIDNDINRLIVGKTLILPDAADIPDAEPQPTPPPAPATTPASDASIDQQKLRELEQALLALQAERNQSDARLTQLEQENSELKNKLASPAAVATPAPDTAAAENLQAMEQERDELRSRLQQLEAEKTERTSQQDSLASDKQRLNEQIQALEAKVAALTADKEAIIAATQHAIPATGDSTETSRAEMDMAALNQQLDLIASANVQLQNEKDTLQKERDELSSRLNELTASKEAANTDTSAGTEPDQAAMDMEILTQQLDAIESANVQLQTEKDALQKELDAAKQQLATPEPAKEPSKDSATAQINDQLQQLQQERDNAQQELKLAHAAKANAELALTQLEKSSSGGSLWPWLLALLLAPLAWFLGRNTVQPLPQKPAPTTHIPAAVTASPPTITTTVPVAGQQREMDGLPADEGQVIATDSVAENTGAHAYPATAANDDNPDAAIKLDIVRAYLDLRDSASAQPILNEVLREGGRQQRQEAREILSFLS